MHEDAGWHVTVDRGQDRVLTARMRLAYRCYPPSVTYTVRPDRGPHIEPLFREREDGDTRQECTRDRRLLNSPVWLIVVHQPFIFSSLPLDIRATALFPAASLLSCLRRFN